MKCLLTLLAIAAGLTIAASPRFQRALFYHDAPATPSGWAPKYITYHQGRPTYKESI